MTGDASCSSVLYGVILVAVVLLGQCRGLSATNRKLLRRQLRKGATASEIQSLLANCTDNAVWAEAVLRSGNLTLSESLFEQHPSEACRSNLIVLLGRAGDVAGVKTLLHNATGVASWHAALAACRSDWRCALELYQEFPFAKSTMTTNILLNVLAKNRRGTEAVEVLKRCVTPSSSSFQFTLQALYSDPRAMYEILRNMTESNLKIQNDMWDLAVRSCTKKKDWETLKQVEALLRPEMTPKGKPTTWNLPKVGKGKTAYFKLGSVCIDGMNVTIGAHPHKGNRPGTTLVFYLGSKKIGFLLAVSAPNRASELLGMEVNTNVRQKGLTKVFLGCWLAACYDTGVQPATSTMHKPLVCASLEHRFGFQANQGGVLAEISRHPTEQDVVVLYSSHARSLEGVLSPWDVRKQNLELVSSPASQQGRPTHLSCRFTAPLDYVDRVKDALHCWPDFAADKEQLLRVLS